MGKNPFLSVTVNGLLVAVLPTVLKFFGIDLDQLLLTDPTFVEDAGTWITTAITLLGGGIALYGRARAKEPLKMPKPPSGSVNVLAVCVALAAATPYLTACQTLASVGLEDEVTSAEDLAYIAASDAFDLWKRTQVIILMYKSWTPCEQAPPTQALCRNAKAWQRMQEIDAQVSPRIVLLRPLLDGKRDDVKWLASIPLLISPAFAEVVTLSTQGR